MKIIKGILFFVLINFLFPHCKKSGVDGNKKDDYYFNVEVAGGKFSLKVGDEVKTLGYLNDYNTIYVGGSNESFTNQLAFTVIIQGQTIGEYVPSGFNVTTTEDSKVCYYSFRTTGPAFENTDMKTTISKIKRPTSTELGIIVGSFEGHCLRDVTGDTTSTVESIKGNFAIPWKQYP